MINTTGRNCRYDPRPAAKKYYYTYLKKFQNFIGLKIKNKNTLKKEIIFSIML